MPQNELVQDLDLDEYKYGFVDEEAHVFRTTPGLDEDVVRQISKHKEEPQWMLDLRLKAFKIYEKKPMPTWGGDLSHLEETLDEIYFYVKPQDQMERSWDDVPDNIKTTFERLGIPEAEQKVLAGVGAQYESEMVYHSLKEEWASQGVIFDSIEDGLKNHPELFREHFGTIIPAADNKFLRTQCRRLVRRVVRLHPEGRPSQDSAAGRTSGSTRSAWGSSSGRSSS